MRDIVNIAETHTVQMCRQLFGDYNPMSVMKVLFALLCLINNS